MPFQKLQKLVTNHAAILTSSVMAVLPRLPCNNDAGATVQRLCNIPAIGPSNEITKPIHVKKRLYKKNKSDTYGPSMQCSRSLSSHPTSQASTTQLPKGVRLALGPFNTSWRLGKQPNRNCTSVPWPSTEVMDISPPRYRTYIRLRGKPTP